MRSKKVLYNITANFVLRIVVILYGFLIPKVIISTYGSNVNGLVTSITQFLSYISLMELGVGPVVKALLYKPLAKKDNKELTNIIRSTEKFFRRISYFFIVYIILLSIIYPLVVIDEFDYLYTFSLIIIVSLSIFAEYYFGMTYRLLIQADQKNYVISIIQIMTYIFSVISVILMAKLKAPIYLLKFVSGLFFIMRPILQNLYVKRKYNLNFDDYNKNYKLENKRDGMLQHIAFVIHTNTDVVILSLFSKLSEVSVYSVYSLINTGLKSFIQSFSSSLESTFGDIIARNEKKILINRFNTYETIYLIVTTIIFSCTLVLAIPFVILYTMNITDADYIRPVFASLIIISEYISVIKQLYYDIVKAAGHFKETKFGALVECFTNLFISIILVFHYGLIGVAIGTLVAMTIRLIEIMYHTNKYILNRSIWESCKKILLVILETLVIVFISRYLPYFENISYFNWIINAIMVAAVAIIITVGFNLIFFRKEFKDVLKILKGIFKKKTQKIN